MKSERLLRMKTKKINKIIEKWSRTVRIVADINQQFKNFQTLLQENQKHVEFHMKRIKSLFKVIPW